MDPREARNYVGYNVHFRPELNPKPSTSPPNKHWLSKAQVKPQTQTQPILIQRQISNTSVGSDSSPVGSPTMGTVSPPTFGSFDLGQKPHLPQPNVYKQFSFNE